MYKNKYMWYQDDMRHVKTPTIYLPSKILLKMTIYSMYSETLFKTIKNILVYCT